MQNNLRRLSQFQPEVGAATYTCQAIGLSLGGQIEHEQSLACYLEGIVKLGPIACSLSFRTSDPSVVRLSHSWARTALFSFKTFVYRLQGRSQLANALTWALTCWRGD